MTRGRRRWAGRAAGAVAALLVVVAVAGPWLAPHDPTDVVGLPFAPPGAGQPLGTDYLGADVASRLLHGGRTVVVLALAAGALAYLVGGGLGLAAGLFGRADTVLMRPVDVLIAVPPFLVLAVLAAGTGRGAAVVVLAAALANVPGIARVVRAATLEVGVRGYVEVALARGETWIRVAGRDVLPNIAALVLTDVGSRISAMVAMVAGANFLGLGLQPPTADWALMVAENRAGLALQPWAVLAPALAIAVLTITVNLGGDELAARLRRATTTVAA
ncbi:ABC transporter permease [Phytohabitans sp. ZYX-F-186]|uniref:ABC transporter permease n=1 Tax=Phytohabitans maris TaxID=3071409 RepID=A0ABU0ZDZ6_9ACTN|nr:ABC transporter permease [Phytohabitans sp. ZYX-F-186]MDQ7905280.1 ABC transporter permease [Phytohabitans sp. ZYX-F-186]